MDYIKQDLAFEDWCENNYLPISAYVIWRKLFKRFNRSGWCEWVTVDNLTLMADTQIKSEKSLILYRNKLIECGLIEYEKGSKGNPNKYKMKKLYTVKNTVKREVESAVETTAQSAVKKEVESAALHYNKTKTKTETKTNSSSEPETGSPPTGEKADVFISFLLNDGSDYEVSVDKVKFYAELYPAVNIEQELRDMTGWCFANKAKRKTRQGAERFINNWLAKRQNMGGGTRNENISHADGSHSGSRSGNDSGDSAQAGSKWGTVTTRL